MYNPSYSENITLVYAISANAVIESFDDGALVLLINSRQMHILNETARDVLQYTNGMSTVAEVASVMAEKYEIPAESILPDLIDLYTHLVTTGIVDAQPSSPPMKGQT
jgi:hypothetical protein